MNANSVGTRGSDPSHHCRQENKAGVHYSGFLSIACSKFFFLFFLLEIFFDAVFAFLAHPPLPPKNWE
jgi:hypothetical protein